MARACDFPFLQKAMRGTARSAATTRLARNITRRHSTGASLSSVSSVTELGALNARFLMKEGIARYENGIFVTRRNFLLGTSSSPPDRKSTRLNSSHQIISYAVFCLKKKKTQ